MEQKHFMKQINGLVLPQPCVVCYRFYTVMRNVRFFLVLYEQTDFKRKLFC